MYTFTTSANELFVKSAEDRVWGLRSKISLHLAKFYYEGDAVQARTHLENLSLQCTSTGDLVEALEALAAIAFCQGRLSNAMDNLQTLIDMSMRQDQDSEGVLWYTVRKAVVTSKQGKYDLARDLFQKASEPFQFFALPSARVFLHRSYGLACIELTAGECDRAGTYFTDTVEACDMQGDLVFKAFSTRGLGEIAFVHRNFALASQHFEETRSLCTEMGVPPQHLYSFFPFNTLPDRFKGWTLFLGSTLPSTNNNTR